MDKVFKYELFNKMIRDFAVNEVKPLAHEVDRARSVSLTKPSKRWQSSDSWA